MNYSERYLFYSQLETLLKSGIPVIKAIDDLSEQSSFKTKTRLKLKECLEGLENGETLSQAIINAHLLENFPQKMIQAGEKGGRLPIILKQMSQNAMRLSQIRKRFLTSLIYPCFLLHLICIVPHLNLLVTQSLNVFLISAFNQIVLFYIFILAAYALILFSSKVFIVRQVFETVSLAVPFLRTMVLDFSLFYFYFIFYNLYSAGYTMGRSFLDSYDLIKYQMVRKKINFIAEKVENDNPLSEALLNQDIFPPQDRSMMLSGEQSGKLEEQLSDLLTIYEDKLEYHFLFIEKFIPKVLYTGVLIFVGYQIISFYQKRMQDLESVMNSF